MAVHRVMLQLIHGPIVFQSDRTFNTIVSALMSVMPLVRLEEMRTRRKLKQQRTLHRRHRYSKQTALCGAMVKCRRMVLSAVCSFLSLEHGEHG
jgi:hypothetical protein